VKSAAFQRTFVFCIRFDFDVYLSVNDGFISKNPGNLTFAVAPPVFWGALLRN